MQVNVSGEASKSGVAPDATLDLLHAIAPLPRLALRGLMGIAEAAPDPARQRAQFGRLRELFEAARAAGLPLDTLSMGMSADLEAAIAEGATLVRVGPALFGARSAGSMNHEHHLIGGGNVARALLGGLIARGRTSGRWRSSTSTPMRGRPWRHASVLRRSQPSNRLRRLADIIAYTVKPQHVLARRASWPRCSNGKSCSPSPRASVCRTFALAAGYRRLVRAMLAFRH